MSIKARSWRSILPMACLTLMLVASVEAREAVLKLDDGRQIRGELISENTEELVLEIAGIRTTFPRARVTGVEYVKSIAEQYQERRSRLADDDLDGRYELARWLYENKSYDQAKSELADLIQRFPKDSRLVPLQNLIEARIKLLEEPAAPAQPRPERPAPTTPAGDAQTPRDRMDFDRQTPHERMTEEHINLIRVYEIDPQAKPNVQIPNEVMEEVYRNYAGQEGVPVGVQAQRQALGWPGWRKLGLLFELRARELYPKATVYDDPRLIQEFRGNIQTRYVLPYCASTACHGGKDAGNFYLFRLEPASNATVYTNYYILHRYNNDKGYMIDREKPDQSFLVQYGLPRADATYPHPDVPGWKPLFRDAKDPRAVSVMQWIRGMGVTTVQYPVDYKIPTMAAPATQPAPAAPGTPGTPGTPAKP